MSMMSVDTVSSAGTMFMDECAVSRPQRVVIASRKEVTGMVTPDKPLPEAKRLRCQISTDGDEGVPNMIRATCSRLQKAMHT